MDSPWPLELINNSPIEQLFLPSLLALYVGRHVVNSYPRCHVHGSRLAVLGLIIYLGERCYSVRPTDGYTLLGLLLRGLLMAGFLAGVGWCILPALAIAGDSLSTSFWRAWQLACAAVRFVSLLIVKPIRALRPRRKQSPAELLEAAREAQQREQKRQEQARIQAAQAERLQADRRRREDAKFACQVLYDRHRAKFGDKFSPDQLYQYFAKYLPDTLPVAEYEQRLEQLKEMILNLADDASGNRSRFPNLEALRAHFRREQEYVQASDYDPEIKQSLISDLAREEWRAVREFRQK